MSTLSNNAILDVILFKPTIPPSTTPPTMHQMFELGKSTPEGFTIIITCADPRLDLNAILPIPGAVIVRSAGGRAVDAMRTLWGLNALFPLGLIVVMHHTDCGLSHTTDEKIRGHIRKVAGDLSDENILRLNQMELGAIRNQDFKASITHDVALIKDDPFFKPDGRNAPDVVGLLYETETGKLNVVVPAGGA